MTATLDRYDRHVMKNYHRAPLTLVRGQGSRVWDDAGRRYLDFTSGIAVNTLGHCDPRWVAAVQRQAADLIHTSNLFRTPAQGLLAERLAAKAGGGRVFFCNSGAEANEALIKLSRLHGIAKSGGEGTCYRVIGAQHAFHGRTFGGMSATPQEKIQKGFRPLTPGFAFGELNNLASFEARIDAGTAAILVETVQGEGGIHACTGDFLRGLRALCDRHNLLLLLDEVQCGIGRTGDFFAYEFAGIRPDAIGMAKGLGGGFPIGAVWAGERAQELFQPGSHGSTFGGTPLACTAALAVLDAIDEEDLLGHVKRTSGPWRSALDRLAVDFPQRVEAVRGRGFMVGIQLTGEAGPVVAALREQGLLAPAAAGTVIRLLPPLNVTAEELAESIACLRRALA